MDGLLEIPSLKRYGLGAHGKTRGFLEFGALISTLRLGAKRQD
jgi:hypothetical protein